MDTEKIKEMKKSEKAKAIKNGQSVQESPDEKLAEKAKTDHKSFSKKEVKEIKDKAKGITRTDDEKLSCAVCGSPILKGQAYKTLPADEKNGRRHYHQSSCSPGSPNWMKFRGDKAKIKLTPKKEAKIIKGAVNSTQGKKHKGEGISNFNHQIAAISGKLDILLIKGTTITQVAKENITKERFLSHVKHLAKDHKISITEKDGTYKIT